MDDNGKLRIVSVSANLPSTKRPELGVFVRRRLAALSKLADVYAIRPQPWFPLLRSFQRPATDLEFPTLGRRMLYFPGLLKRMDSWWMQRAIEPIVYHRHRNYPIDVLDAHFGYPTGAACYSIGRQLGIPVFTTLRGVEAKQLNDPRIGPLLIEALKGCAGIIAVSHSLRDAAISAGIAQDKICVIPNAVNRDMFYPANQKDARERTQLPPDVPIIISVGYLIHRKGYHNLLPAFHRVRRAYPDARLVIVGGSSHERTYPGRIRRQIDELDLSEAVHLTGAIAPGEVGQWLSAADVFALATYREGCCNAVLEAMGCGLPAVVTPAGDNDRYVDPGQNGYLVPIGDVDGLSRALIEALSRSWDRNHIAASVHSLTWADVADAVLDFMRIRLGGKTVGQHSVCASMNAK